MSLDNQPRAWDTLRSQVPGAFDRDTLAKLDGVDPTKIAVIHQLGDTVTDVSTVTPPAVIVQRSGLGGSGGELYKTVEVVLE